MINRDKVLLRDAGIEIIEFGNFETSKRFVIQNKVFVRSEQNLCFEVFIEGGKNKFCVATNIKNY